MQILLPFSLFQYDQPVYEGFRTESVSAPNFEKDCLPHNPYKCLECSIPLNKVHHRSHSDVSLVSSENLAFSLPSGAIGGGVGGTGGSSSNSLSPVVRSRSHTLESSAPSSGESGGNTPHSTTSSSSNKGSPKPPNHVGTSRYDQVMVNGGGGVGEKRAARGVREAELAAEEEKRPKSPLVRMKRVISEGAVSGSEGAGVAEARSASSKSSEGTAGEGGSDGAGKGVVSPGDGTGSSSGGGGVVSSSGSGREGGEEEEGGGEEGKGDGKKSNEVMINVIEAR